MLITRTPDNPTVAVYALWPGGTLVEPPAHNGISHLLARLLARCGVPVREAGSHEVAWPGGRIAGVSGRSSFGLRAQWPAENWRAGLELTAHCLLNRKFDYTAIRQERRQIAHGLSERQRDPRQLAYRALAEMLYPHHPYRMPIAGRVETLARLGRRELAAFYRKTYPLGGLTVAVAGPVAPDQVLAELRRLFAGTPERVQRPGQPPPHRAAGQPAQSREIYIYRAGQRAHLLIGFPGLAIGHSDHHALEIVAAIASDRLARALRRQELHAQVSARSVPSVELGHIAVYLTCSADRLSQAFDIARAELAAVATAPPLPDELERAKRELIAIHDRSLARPASIAAALAFHEAHGLPAAAIASYDVAIAQVTGGQVQQTAARFLDWSRVVLATVAPLSASPEAWRRIRGEKRRRIRRSRSNRPGRSK